MKKILFTLAITFSCFAFGQKVKLKNDKLFIDDKECMKYTSKELGTKNSFFSLDGKPLFFLDVISTGKGIDDGYIKISFTDSEEIVTMGVGYSKKSIVSQLIEMGVIDNCKINSERIKDYVKRYDQKYEQSIIRHTY
ncbi:hypothetical protein [Chryseobacterium sp.]|uniref:hypothetical protein n=1 Tax=Chryseobacterium sp. TaxID=1871047 RepID=UPI0024E1BA33|nr:hypothetical protein [Chryseobacterium sp.]